MLGRRVQITVLIGFLAGVVIGAFMIYDGMTGQTAYQYLDDYGSVSWGFCARRMLYWLILSICSSLILLVDNRRIRAGALVGSLVIATSMLWVVWDDHEFISPSPPGGVDASRIISFYIAFFLHSLTLAILSLGAAHVLRRAVDRPRSRRT